MKLVSEKTSRKKLLFLLSAVIALTCAAWLIFAYQVQTWPFPAPGEKATPSEKQVNSVDYGVASDDQVTAGIEAKKNTTTDTPPSDTAKSTGPTVTITTASRSGDIFYIRTLIDTVTSGGSCELVMNGPGEKTYTAASSVQNMAETSTCQGFNVPFSSLSSGTWTIRLNYTNSTQSSTATKEVSL